MKIKQWNKILKDLGWDDPSYGWTKEKSILKRALKYEKQQILELECLKEIKHDNFCLHEDVEELDCDCGADEVNQKINEIKEEIRKI